MAKKKIEYQLFYLKSENAEDGTLLLKARCNEAYMKLVIERVRKGLEDIEYTLSEEELLQEILIEDDVEYEILTPTRLRW